MSTFQLHDCRRVSWIVSTKLHAIIIQIVQKGSPYVCSFNMDVSSPVNSITPLPTHPYLLLVAIKSYLCLLSSADLSEVWRTQTEPSYRVVRYNYCVDFVRCRFQLRKEVYGINLLCVFKVITQLFVQLEDLCP